MPARDFARTALVYLGLGAPVEVPDAEEASRAERTLSAIAYAALGGIGLALVRQIPALGDDQGFLDVLPESVLFAALLCLGRLVADAMHARKHRQSD